MIEFSSPLLRGKLLRRYKRFFADVVLDDGTEVVAHCPNTGTMKTCSDSGMSVLLTSNDSPTRKLKFTWELAHGQAGWIGVNTHRTNTVVHAAISQGYFDELCRYPVLTSEVTWQPGTRFDFGLSALPAQPPEVLIEVKHATLLADDAVIFPDCVSERARKHALELINVVKSGRRAILLFVVNRPDRMIFRPAWEIDPQYAQAVIAARNAGVEIWAVRCQHDAAGSRLTDRVKVDWNWQKEVSHHEQA